MQYLLTCSISTYCVLALNGGICLHVYASDHSIRKQDDPYPIPTRTQHFYQPVPNTNPYPIPTRTIYLTHVMACNAWLSSRCQGRPGAAGGAANVSSRCHAKRAYDIPVYQLVPYTSNTEHTHYFSFTSRPPCQALYRKYTKRRGRRHRNYIFYDRL